MNSKVFFCVFLLSCTLQALPGDAREPLSVSAYTVVIDERKGVSTYTGNAKVVQGSLILSAEKIQVFSSQKSVIKVVAKGTKNKRAHYQQNQTNQPRFIEATALKIVYLMQKESMHLQGKAHLVQGFDSFSGGTLDYDIKNDRVVIQSTKKRKSKGKGKSKAKGKGKNKGKREVVEQVKFKIRM